MCVLAELSKTNSKESVSKDTLEESAIEEDKTVVTCAECLGDAETTDVGKMAERKAVTNKLMMTIDVRIP